MTAIENHMLETTNCPVCNQAEHQPAYTFEPFSIVRCDNCDAFYLSPRLKEEAAIELYEQDSYYFEEQDSGYTGYLEQEKALRRTFQRFLKTLKTRQLTGGRLLEVGCGYGFLLDEAKPYFDYRAGTDFSAEAVSKAELLADDIYQGGLDSIPENSRFNCIVATNVLEHTYNPADFLSTLHSHLEPGGCIVMAVPNMASFLRFVLGKKWPSFKVPEHTIYFKQDTLQRTFREANLSRIEEIPFPHAFSLQLILGKFNIPLPDMLNDVSLWIPTTMTACVGYKNDESQ